VSQITGSDLRYRAAPVRAILTSLTAVLAATVVSFLFDVGVSLARGWSPGLGYTSVCAGFAVGGALVVGGTVGWTRRPELALAGWVALNAAVSALVYVPADWLSALSLAAVTWVALLPNDRRQTAPLSAGIAVGLALSLCAVILPRLFGVVGVERPRGELYLLTVLATLGGTLLTHSLYSRFQPRFRWLPPATPLTVALGTAAVLMVPLALTGPPAQVEVELRGPGSTEPRPSAAGPAPTVIVLVLDTVRADHLSIYGYRRDTTPALQAFVDSHERAVVYPLAFSPATWTLPAHASLFTGLLPSSHGAHSGSLLDLRHALAPNAQLEAEATLAEVMKSQGYRTAAILANAQVMFFRGMERGFDQIVRPQPAGWLALTGERLRQLLAPWWYGHATKPYPLAATISHELLRYLDDCGTSRCFVVANYMEAHWPFLASPRFQGTYTGGQWPGAEAQRYDEELLGLDAELGELLEALDRRRVLDRAWLVITADHGEEFREHGAQHGTSVYNDQVRIPLLIHPPRGEAVVERSDAVGLLDVTATLTAAVGAAPLGAGRDLRNQGGQGAVPIEWYGDPGLAPARRSTGRAVVVGSTKLVDSEGRRELYELDSDPWERDDLALSAPARVRTLAEQLPPLTPPSEGGASADRELSFDEVERLKALGYAD
jgi:arylsulfatase A-like enzyme